MAGSLISQCDSARQVRIDEDYAHSFLPHGHHDATIWTQLVNKQKTLRLIELALSPKRSLTYQDELRFGFTDWDKRLKQQHVWTLVLHQRLKHLNTNDTVLDMADAEWIGNVMLMWPWYNRKRIASETDPTTTQQQPITVKTSQSPLASKSMEFIVWGLFVQPLPKPPSPLVPQHAFSSTGSYGTPPIAHYGTSSGGRFGYQFTPQSDQFVYCPSPHFGATPAIQYRGQPLYQYGAPSTSYGLQPATQFTTLPPPSFSAYSANLYGSQQATPLGGQGDVGFGLQTSTQWTTQTPYFTNRPNIPSALQATAQSWANADTALTRRDLEKRLLEEIMKKGMMLARDKQIPNVRFSVWVYPDELPTVELYMSAGFTYTNAEYGGFTACSGSDGVNRKGAKELFLICPINPGPFFTSG